MPVQVNEIIIRATVSEGGDTQQPAQPKTGKGNSADASDKDSIVAECVEQVLDILKKEIKR